MTTFEVGSAVVGGVVIDQVLRRVVGKYWPRVLLHRVGCAVGWHQWARRRNGRACAWCHRYEFGERR